MECGCRLVVDHEVATELESPIGSPIAIAPTAICHGAGVAPAAPVAVHTSRGSRAERSSPETDAITSRVIDRCDTLPSH
jgi:hypothetical protein